MWNPWWNDIDRGKLKDSERNLSQCHFVHYKSHWTDPGVNPGCHGERPATNCLSHGTAHQRVSSLVIYTHFYKQIEKPQCNKLL
jgi:hypothetical protein